MSDSSTPEYSPFVTPESSGERMGFEGCDVHVVHHDPGTEREDHTHGEEHIIFIRAGRMEWSVDGEARETGPGIPSSRRPTCRTGGRFSATKRRRWSVSPRRRNPKANPASSRESTLTDVRVERDSASSGIKFLCLTAVGAMRRHAALLLAFLVLGLVVRISPVVRPGTVAPNRERGRIPARKERRVDSSPDRLLTAHRAELDRSAYGLTTGSTESKHGSQGVGKLDARHPARYRTDANPRTGDVLALSSTGSPYTAYRSGGVTILRANQPNGDRYRYQTSEKRNLLTANRRQVRAQVRTVLSSGDFSRTARKRGTGRPSSDTTRPGVRRRREFGRSAQPSSSTRTG